MGGPVIDPTKNVLDLTNAANKRQDDLREMYNRFMGAEIARLEERTKRVEQISDLRAEHAREVNMIHQSHDREIHKMEQDKLAAFRASDEMARITEANRSLAAIQVVERTLNSTATALASQNAENNVEVNRRLAALEKSSYEGAGKGTGAKNLWVIIAGALGLLITLFMASLTVGGIVVAIAFAIKK
jgi:hypothetical protein